MNHKKNKKNKLRIFYILIILLLIYSTSVISAPPEPLNVEGKIFNNDSSGAQNGLKVIVLNLNTSQEFTTQVFAPPSPGLAGSYSLTILGSIGDIINVTSYNTTNYGQATYTITKSTTKKADVTLNISRDAEANLTIIAPTNNSLYNTSNIFNVTVNMSVLGANGINCDVTLNISDESIIGFNTGTNMTNNLGNINLGQIKNTTFELIALTVGTTTLNATGICQNSGTNFENLQSYQITIQTQDKNPPTITPISPLNNTDNKSKNNIDIKFNVSDESNINNCQLFINGTSNQTLNNPTKDTKLTFNTNLANDVYAWHIECTDEYFNTGITGNYNLNISVYHPTISFDSMQQNIMLNAGTTTNIVCNISVTDKNGASDINAISSTFYNQISTSQSSNNYTNHYTNNSCQNVAVGENQKNYSCTFPIEYYALNGTWNCNATATDLQNLNGTNETNTSIQPLFALNLSSLTIDYGLVTAGAISDNKSIDVYNIGNQNINISVKGYGGTNPITGNNTAMLCQSGENITITDQKYSTSITDVFNQKISLLSTEQDLMETLPKQTTQSVIPRTTTYWQLKANISDVTNCNGTLIVTAKQP